MRPCRSTFFSKAWKFWEARLVGVWLHKHLLEEGIGIGVLVVSLEVQGDVSLITTSAHACQITLCWALDEEQHAGVQRVDGVHQLDEEVCGSCFVIQGVPAASYNQSLEMGAKLLRSRAHNHCPSFSGATWVRFIKKRRFFCSFRDKEEF